MRAKGINYDTGFFGFSRRSFEPDVVARELRIIADDLHCTAVRISGEHPERLLIAGERALAAGLEVWFAPFPSDLDRHELLAHFRDCATLAQQLRRQSPNVVFVLGCELSLFANGFLPGTTALDRIEALLGRDRPSEPHHALGDVSDTLNAFLAEATELVRSHFDGPITYASGKWEQVDWTLFDITAVDLYRDQSNSDVYRDKLRSYFRHGNPVAITEFGCCTFRGAAQQGGVGWMVVDTSADPPVRADCVRDETEQAELLRELLELFDEEGVDSAFWFTFAGYELPHRQDPRYDLDMGAYGVVKVLEEPNGSAPYPGMRWQPKESFHALADVYARLP